MNEINNFFFGLISKERKMFKLTHIENNRLIPSELDMNIYISFNFTQKRAAFCCSFYFAKILLRFT